MFDRLKRPGETDEDPQSTTGPSVPKLQLARETVELAGSPTLYNFTLDSALLTSEHRDQLRSLAQLIQRYRAQYPGILVITGHTDATGTAEHNQELGQRRAKAVESELLLLGLPSTMLFVSFSPGAAQPLVDTPKAEPLNRRVEITYRTAQPSLVMPGPVPPPPDIWPKPSWLPPPPAPPPAPGGADAPPAAAKAPAKDDDAVEVTTSLGLRFKDGEIYHVVNVEVTISVVKPHDVALGRAFKVSFGQLDLKASLELTTAAKGGKLKLKEFAGEFGTDFTIVSVKADRAWIIPKGTTLELDLNIKAGPDKLTVQAELEGKLKVPITSSLSLGAKADSGSATVFLEWKF
jgi:outer membrane protein OmpA-like peptidoglycan-associated protein